MVERQDSNTVRKFYVNDWNDFNGNIENRRFKNKHLESDSPQLFQKESNIHPKFDLRQPYQQTYFAVKGEFNELPESKLPQRLRLNKAFVPHRQKYKYSHFRDHKPWNNHLKDNPSYFTEQKYSWNPFLEMYHDRRQKLPSTFENGFNKKRELPLPKTSYKLQTKPNNYRNSFHKVKAEAPDRTNQDDDEIYSSVFIGVFSLFALMCIPLLIAVFWYAWRKVKNRKQPSHKVRKKSNGRKNQRKIPKLKTAESISPHKFHALREKIENQLKAGNFNIEMKYSPNNKLNAYKEDDIYEKNSDEKCKLQPNGLKDDEASERNFSALNKRIPFSLKATGEELQTDKENLNLYNFEENKNVDDKKFHEENIRNPFSLDGDGAIDEEYSVPIEPNSKILKKNAKKERQVPVDGNQNSENFEEVAIKERRILGPNKVNPLGFEQSRITEQNYSIQSKPVPHNFKKTVKNEPNFTIFANLNPYNFEELVETSQRPFEKSKLNTLRFEKDDENCKKVSSRIKSYPNKHKNSDANDRRITKEACLNPTNLEEIRTFAKKSATRRNLTTQVNSMHSPNFKIKNRNEDICFEKSELNTPRLKDPSEDIGVNKAKISRRNKVNSNNYVPRHEISFADHFNQIYSRRNLYH